MESLYFFLVHPTPYHEFFLKNIEKKLNKEINLEVYFMEGTNSMYPWKSTFRSGFKSKQLSGHFFNFDLIKKIITEQKATFILVGWERFDKIFLIALMGLLGRKYLIYTDTPYDNRARSFFKKTIRDNVLKLIANTSYGLIVTGNIGVRVIKNWPIKFRHVVNLPTFIDHDFFKPKPNNNIESKELVFFSSGRLLNIEKGYDIALEALSNLKNKKLISDFRYLIAGEGPDRDTIETQIKQLNLQDNVNLLGWMEPGQLLFHYQNCSFFLHASRQDAYPNAIMEAMACNCIIISSDNAGSAVDRITHRKNGYLFKTGDSISLESTIIDAISNRNKNNNIRLEVAKSAEEWSVKFGLKQIQNIVFNKLQTGN